MSYRTYINKFYASLVILSFVKGVLSMNTVAKERSFVPEAACLPVFSPSWQNSGFSSLELAPHLSPSGRKQMFPLFPRLACTSLWVKESSDSPRCLSDHW
jgi:hypothetical protein